MENLNKLLENVKSIERKKTSNVEEAIVINFGEYALGRVIKLVEELFDVKEYSIDYNYRKESVYGEFVV